MNPDNSISLSKSYIDLMDALNEVLLFVQDYDNRSPVQAKILLKNHYEQLIKFANLFVLDESIKAKEKIDVYLQLLSKFRLLLNQIPHSISTQKILLDLNSLYNFIKLNLASLHYNSNVISGYSTATLLMDILVEPVELLDELPDLPPVDDLQEFSEVFVSLLNFLQTSFGIYQTLITQMRIFHKDDIILWTNNALWFFMLTYDLLTDKFDAKALLATGKFKNMSSFYDNILAYISILRDMDSLLPDILAILTTNLSDLQPNALFNEFTLSEFYGVHMSIESYVGALMQVIDDGIVTGIINRNDRINTRAFYPDYIIGTLSAEWLKLKYEFFISKERDIDLIVANIEAGEKVMEQIIGQAGGIQELINSYYLNPYLSAYEDLLLFYSLQAVHTHDVQLLEQVIDSHDSILRQVAHNEALSLHIHLARLFTYSHLHLSIDFAQIFSKLYSNLEHLQLIPRSYLASVIMLVNIAPLLTNVAINIDDLFALGIEYGMIDEQSVLYQDLQKYHLHIMDPEVYPADTLLYRQKIVAFDSTTVIIPDFSFYYTAQKIPVRTYIPFNRKADMIQ